MTAYIVFKNLNEGKLKPDQMLKVSEKAWKAEGSRMFLEMKKPVSVGDLVKGLIVQSGNDAAITLAESVAGSEAKFVELMNAEAKRLGMNKTTFENSTGLPGKKHLTTVNDLVTLSDALIRDFPDYYAIYSLKEFTYNGIKQPNRNLLLFRDPSVDGLKTGHTNSAGYNLIASSKRNGRRVVSVVVGTNSQEARATESSKLLNYALQNFDTPKMYQAGQAVSHIKVFKGALREVPIGFLNDEYITLPHGHGQDIVPKLETNQPVLAPIQKGAEMGVIKFMHKDKVLAEKKVYALQDVAEAGFVGKFWDSITLWFNEIFAG
ncbi:D-alanyl-D-alanine carboxypeptidase family protein [Alysiella crassa]|uniref:serine-type D-Ala-D-Ala carboxypeptidase n=1 Tax=Alysiella crassa TaxID=153491 RepID=A0A376BUV0_9NEIS|nr:D-alanyl-D-alanine carboxypeptidase dacA precursor [Alysiella crassa]